MAVGCASSQSEIKYGNAGIIGPMAYDETLALSLYYGLNQITHEGSSKLTQASASSLGCFLCEIVYAGDFQGFYAFRWPLQEISTEAIQAVRWPYVWAIQYSTILESYQNIMFQFVPSPCS